MDTNAYSTNVILAVIRTLHLRPTYNSLSLLEKRILDTVFLPNWKDTFFNEPMPRSDKVTVIKRTYTERY